MLLNTVQMISAFSFFIYLLHPIILDSLFAYTNIFEDNTVVFLAVSLLMILGICIGVGMILREFYIFRFVIGKQPYKLQFNHYQPSWKSHISATRRDKIDGSLRVALWVCGGLLFMRIILSIL